MEQSFLIIVNPVASANLSAQYFDRTLTHGKFSDPEFQPTPERIAKDNQQTSFDYFDSAANVARW